MGEGSDDDDDDDDAWNALLARQQRLGRGWGRGIGAVGARSDVDDDDEIDEPKKAFGGVERFRRHGRRATPRTNRPNSIPSVDPPSRPSTRCAPRWRRRFGDRATRTSRRSRAATSSTTVSNVAAVIGARTKLESAPMGPAAGRDRRAGARPDGPWGGDVGGARASRRWRRLMAERDAGSWAADADASEGSPETARAYPDASRGPQCVAFVARAAESSVAAAAEDDETPTPRAGRRSR